MLVHFHTICLRVTWAAQRDLVPQGVVVMAAHIVDVFLRGGGEIADTAYHSALNAIDQSPGTCCKSSRRSIKDAAAKGIPAMSIEHGHAQSLLPPLGAEFGAW